MSYATPYITLKHQETQPLFPARGEVNPAARL
jgi:hypothetical protein